MLVGWINIIHLTNSQAHFCINRKYSALEYDETNNIRYML